MMRAHQDQRRPRWFRRAPRPAPRRSRRDRCRRRRASCASRTPRSACARSSENVMSVPADSVTWLSSYRQISLPSLQVAGQRRGLRCHAFHQVAVADDGRRCGGRRSRGRRGCSARRGAPRRSPCRPRWRGPARAGPWSTSTPGVWPRSGWPGVLLPHWRNCLMSSSDRS